MDNCIKVLSMVLLAFVTSKARGAPVEKSDETPAGRFAWNMTKVIHTIHQENIPPGTEPDLVCWSIVGLYEAMKKPIPMQIARRLQEVDKAGAKEIWLLLRDARAELGSRKDLNAEIELEICLRAIFRHLEPGLKPEQRSGYIRSDKLERFRSGGVGAIVGIGLIVKRDRPTGMLQVDTPILGGPAYKAGLRAGDIITEISIDTDVEGNVVAKPLVVSTRGLSVERAHQLFQGQWKTRVKLKVVPAGRGKKK